MAILASAALTLAADAERAASPAPDSQVPLTRNEIARLLAALIIRPQRDTAHSLHWSRWRRRH